MSRNEAIEITPVSPAFGAEIRGVDLASESSQELLDRLRDALACHGVLFFRDQTLRPEDQIRFAERLGKIVVNRFFAPVKEFPQIAEVRKEPDQKINVGGSWHTDHSYDEIPALGSILCAREVPDQGGDTLFASTAAAHDALSEGLRETLSGMRALHSSRHVFGKQAGLPRDLAGRIGNADRAHQDALHPVVITHPRSGRKCLYVNPGFTLRFEGWSSAESRPLLEYLYQQVIRPEFTTRFRWQPGSVAIWDNRSTWHYAANDYHGRQRLMHRITLEGEPLST